MSHVSRKLATPVAVLLLSSGLGWLRAQPVSTAASATISVSSSANPSIFGAPVTFTIAVTGPTSTSPVPTGTIIATLPGPTEIGAASLDSSGRATITVPEQPSPLATLPWGLPAGQNDITFAYSGDSKYPAAQSKFIQWVNKADTKTTAAVKGTSQPQQLVATVSIDQPSSSATQFSLPPNLSSSQPTGTVQFFNGAALLGTATLTPSGLFTSTATLSVVTTPASLTAVYSGDNNYNGSTSAPVVGGGKGSVGLTVISSVNPSTFARPVTLAIAVTPSTAGGSVPTGTVSASLLGLFNLGSTTLDSSGKAAITVPASGAAKTLIPWGLPAAMNSITFNYSGDATYAAAQTDFTQTVTQAATATTAAISGSTITATVSIDEPSVANSTFAIPGGQAATAAPGGSVQFLSGSTVLGTEPLTPAGLFQSSAGIPLPVLPSNATLVAVYNGDANYTGSTSPPATIPVLPAVTVSVQSSANPSTFAAPVTLSISVAAATAATNIPTGTVQATVLGADVLGSATLDSSGKASITIPLQLPLPYSLANLPWGLATGSNAITVTYSGDANFGAGTNTFNQTVNQAATQTTVVLAPVTTSANMATVVATVSIDEASVSKLDFRIPAPGSLNTSPTGTVQFYDGATLLGSATLTPGVSFQSTALFTSASVPASVRAVYVGDTSYIGSTSSSTGLGNGAVNLTLQSSSNPAVYGVAFTILATVAPATAGGPTPTGTLQLFVGSKNLNVTVSLNGNAQGALQFPIPEPTAQVCALVCPPPENALVLGGGSHTITAQYSGDANYAAATSTIPLTQQISKAPTTTQASAFEAVLGTPVASGVNATVSDAQPPAGGPYHFQAMTASGAVDGDPSGTVTFYSGSNQLGTGTLAPSPSGNITSIASLNTSGTTTLANVSASYPGDANFQASSSPTAAPTSVTLSASPNPSATGQSVTITATVIPGAASPAPTGKVTFFDGITLLGTSTVSGGVATLATSFTSAGSHSLTATYGGDVNYQGSTSPVYIQAVTGATIPTDRLTLTISASTAVFGQHVVLFVQVSGNITTPPTGTVNFLDGTTAIGSGTLAQGSTYVLVMLPVGTHQISATWAGDSNWPAAKSAVVGLTVNRAATAVTLTCFDTAWTAVVMALPPGAGTPTGTVQFVDLRTQAVLATGTLSGGSATVTLSNVTDPVQAVYSGDSDFNPSKSRLTGSVLFHPRK